MASWDERYFPVIFVVLVALIGLAIVGGLYMCGHSAHHCAVTETVAQCSI